MLTQKPMHIYLVEDNQQDELLTIRALKKSNIHNEILVARDGAEALEHLLNTEELPQVVLLDLKLPKVSGLEVLRKLRENPKTKRLPSNRSSATSPTSTRTNPGSCRS
jgi:two-component system response regulator